MRQPGSYPLLRRHSEPKAKNLGFRREYPLRATEILRQLTQKGGHGRENYAYILIAESGNAISKLYAEDRLYTDPERCERLHNTEAEGYELLYYAKGDPRDLEASRISRDRGKFDCYKK